MIRILAIAGALLGLASAAQADVWRWTDPNGTTHYSDSWVPGSTLIKTDASKGNYSAPAPAPDSASASNGASRTPSEQADAQRDQRTVANDVAKAKADQCKKASEAYETAIHSRRIYQAKQGGEREYLSDADADAYRLQLLNARKQACGS
jgi:septal ring-binding cell division protein DamX